MTKHELLCQKYGPSGQYFKEAKATGLLGWCWRKSCDGYSTLELSHFLGLPLRTIQRYLVRYAHQTGLKVPRSKVGAQG